MSEPRSRWVGCLAALPALALQLLVGLLRLGVFLGAWVWSAAAGGLVSAIAAGWVHGPIGALLGGVLGLFVVPVAFTVGCFAWLVPGTLRALATSEDPEVERVIPTRLDGALFVAVALGMAILGGSVLGQGLELPPGVLELGFAGVLLPAQGAILATGGRKVADIWWLLLTSLPG